MSLRPRLTVPRLIALAAGAWAVVAVVLVLSGGRQLSQGVTKAEHTRAAATAGDVLDGSVDDDLREVEAHFRRAHGRLANPVLEPLRWLPVAGRQLRAVEGMAATAAEAMGAAREAAAGVQAIAREPRDRPEQRVGSLRRLATVAADAAARLQAVDRGPGHALIGPVAARRARLDTEVDQLITALGRAEAAASAAAALLDGPSRYLLIAANNAEMRAGSGMFLTAGTVSFEAGRFSIGELVPTAELALPGDGVPLDDPDLQARWGWMHPGREWRSLGATPRFDVNAALAARMWAERTGEQVDGVILMDAVAVAALLAATGPVEVAGRMVDAQTAVPFITYEQYVGFDESDEAFAARQELLGGIARTVAGQLDEGGYDLAVLGQELAAAAGGRHLLLWARDPAQQRAWHEAGVSGALKPESLLVSVMNRGGNKLDPFLQVDAALAVDERPGAAEVTVRIGVTNDAPADAPPYVAGPHPGSDGEAGEYVGIVSVNLPGPASGGRIEERDSLAAVGRDGPARVLAAAVRLPAGAREELTVRFSLPAGSSGFVVEPDARVPPVSWRFGGEAWTGTSAHRVQW